MHSADAVHHIDLCCTYQYALFGSPGAAHLLSAIPLRHQLLNFGVQVIYHTLETTNLPCQRSFHRGGLFSACSHLPGGRKDKAFQCSKFGKHRKCCCSWNRK